MLVIGAGPIGVSCALNVQTYGAAVYLADTNEARRNFVKNRFSLEVLDPIGYDYAKEIAYITQGDNFDAVIDTTAVKASMDSAWRYITQGGQVVYVGICGSSIALEGLPFHLKEPTLGTTRNSRRIFSGSFGSGSWVCWTLGSLSLTQPPSRKLLRPSRPGSLPAPASSRVWSNFPNDPVNEVST